MKLKLRQMMTFDQKSVMKVLKIKVLEIKVFEDQK